MVAARKIAMNVKLPSYYILFFPKQRRILLCNLPDLIGSGADDRGKLAGPTAVSTTTVSHFSVKQKPESFRRTEP